ncbi:MAG: hypothetical protein R2838_21895 [Caldilineaceae bacterium]
MSDPEAGLPAWLELRWPGPINPAALQLIFDTGLHRPLTSAIRTPTPAHAIWGASAVETVRDYVVEGCVDGEWQQLVAVTHNHQRRRVHALAASGAVDALRATVTATNGLDHARICEVRAYDADAPVWIYPCGLIRIHPTLHQKGEHRGYLSSNPPAYTSVGGIFPHLALSAELGPPRSECGIGGLFAWAGKLWAMTYVSHKTGSGVGTGLYVIDETLSMTKHPESRVGTYTNRYVHFPSNQLFFGPHVIDADGNVKTVEELVEVRTCSTMQHLTDPDNKVYVLGMEGEFFEMDVHTHAVVQIADLVEELYLPTGKYDSATAFAHFKAGYSNFGRVVVANNSYDEDDFGGRHAAGRLAEWDGQTWRVIEHTAFVEVTGRGNFSGTIFATGWDRASAILMVYTAADDTWRKYRLPKASHTFDHMWQTEWPRIREVEHERFLMDHHGMFYELSPWGVRQPHLGRATDFDPPVGAGRFLYLPRHARSRLRQCQPAPRRQSPGGRAAIGTYFGKTDDLWQFGKPAGWGGPWWDTAVTAGDPSDPYLMTGFDAKVLHLTHGADSAVTVTVDVDFLEMGRGISMTPSRSLARYVHHEFPAGFSAHWVRVTADTDCVATAYFTYT